MAVFGPGTNPPFALTPTDVPRLVFDMLEHGYVATLNPKWRFGHTLGTEDLAHKWEETLTEEERAGRAKWEKEQNDLARERAQVKGKEPVVAEISRDAWQAILGIALRHDHLDPGSSVTATSNEAESAARKTLAGREKTAAKLIQRAWRKHRVRTAEAELPPEIATRPELLTYYNRSVDSSREELFKAFRKLATADDVERAAAEASKTFGKEEIDFLKGRLAFLKQREKFAIFRKIAEATKVSGVADWVLDVIRKTADMKIDWSQDAEWRDAVQRLVRETVYPETIFQLPDPLPPPPVGVDTINWGEEWRSLARKIALEQEKGSGRLGYKDFHGHELPVDASRIDLQRE